MPSLQIRDLPEEIYQKLQIEAKKAHRSFSQQAMVAIERGLHIIENPRERRHKLLQEISKYPSTFDVTKLPDPVDLIRADRKR